MSENPFTFAIIGCGTIAPTHAAALAALDHEDVRLAACCDILPERAAALAEAYGLRPESFESILNDSTIDAVTLCVPSGLHAEIGVKCLEAGKHVIVEKPMDISLDACDRLIAAADKSGKTLAVISQHRFDSASILVKQTIDAGDLGPIILTEANIAWYRTQEYYDSGDWRGTWAMDGGGCLMNQGVHTLDLLLWLAGRVDSVYAQARTAAHERIEVEDSIVAALSFANGSIGSLLASTSTYPGFAARLAIHGARGSAIIEGDCLKMLAIKDQDLVAGQTPAAHAMQIATGGTRSASAEMQVMDAADTETAVWGDAHRAQISDFIRSCRNGTRPVVDGREGRKAVELILSLYESARKGEVIQVTS